MNHYKDIFFDLDHTIWDFETNAKATLADLYNTDIASKINAPFDDFFNRYSYHNTTLWAQYERGELSVEDLKWKRMYRALLDFKIGDEQLSRTMSVNFLEILPTKKEVFPHTFEILKYLKNKNYALHLITNGFTEVQTNKLKNSGLNIYFDELITSEGSNSVKPQPQIFEYAITKTNATKVASIMIGDNQHADINGAINFGIDAVFVNHINANIECKPTYTITHLQQLENIL
jgi:putative hydrolase of the HAD superfamily